MSDQPMVCIPGAIPAEKRAEYDQLREWMSAETQAVTELATGYVLTFPNSGLSITHLAQFISLERLCCPFLTFALVVSADQVELHLTGADGVKDFLRQELL